MTCALKNNLLMVAVVSFAVIWWGTKHQFMRKVKCLIHELSTWFQMFHQHNVTDYLKFCQFKILNKKNLIKGCTTSCIALKPIWWFFLLYKSILNVNNLLILLSCQQCPLCKTMHQKYALLAVWCFYLWHMNSV